MSLFVNWLKNKANKVYRFLAYICRRFIIDGNIYQVSILTYASLLAIVPLIFVSFYALSELSLFKEAGKQIQDFIFDNFVPATGHTVQLYVLHFAKQASSLSISGVLFLVLTAVAMIFTIETAFNEIWGIKVRRHGVKAFLLYLASLILGPILIGLTIMVSSYLISLPFLGTFDVMKTWLLSWAPFILTFITFFLMYIGIPNTKVKKSSALIGALVATILLELTKVGFTLYVAQFHTYELLYGAFSTIPIFLFWLYLVWVIVLLGAEITHALSSSYLWRLGPKMDPFTQTLIWLNRLNEAKKENKSVSLSELINQDEYGYQFLPNEIMSKLVEANLVTLVNKDSYFLKADLSNITFGEIYQLLPWKIPTLDVIESYKLPNIKLYKNKMSSLYQATAEYFEKPVSEWLQAFHS